MKKQCFYNVPRDAFYITGCLSLLFWKKRILAGSSFSTGFLFIPQIVRFCKITGSSELISLLRQPADLQKSQFNGPVRPTTRCVEPAKNKKREFSRLPRYISESGQPANMQNLQFNGPARPINRCIEPAKTKKRQFSRPPRLTQSFNGPAKSAEISKQRAAIHRTDVENGILPGLNHIISTELFESPLCTRHIELLIKKLFKIKNTTWNRELISTLDST